MENVELHIAGQGSDGENVRALFAGVPNVVFHGTLDKEGVRGLLYEADALVLASRSEAQVLVIMEAVCTGIPAVTTTLSRNVMVEGPFFVAKKGDACSLRQRMQEVMHTEFDPRWSEALRQRVAPDVIARQIMQVFNQG
jgi:glycosyltransferase involved in cell wall biosynthesis